MKRQIAILFLAAILGCNRPSGEFKGLGGIEIGKDFASVRESKSFTNTMKNEYFVQEYELGDGIGKVSKLNITTNDLGRIIEVRFFEDPKTNVAEIKKSIAGLKPLRNAAVAMPGGLEVQARISSDSSVVFSQVTSKLSVFSNGLPKREFRYGNLEAAKQNAEVIKKSILAGQKEDEKKRA